MPGQTVTVFLLKELRPSPGARQPATTNHHFPLDRLADEQLAEVRRQIAQYGSFASIRANC